MIHQVLHLFHYFYHHVIFIYKYNFLILIQLELFGLVFQKVVNKWKMIYQMLFIRARSEARFFRWWGIINESMFTVSNSATCSPWQTKLFVQQREKRTSQKIYLIWIFSFEKNTQFDHNFYSSSRDFRFWLNWTYFLRLVQGDESTKPNSIRVVLVPYWVILK